MKKFSFLILFAVFAAPIFAQSTNENFPTPVVQNEISGIIAARDVGDSRLTRYFYTFFADNGDMNLSVETTNFDGDLDLFESETLRPLAKITIASAGGIDKTSRIIYFRRREQIVLRIEGKSLTDEAARYRISFSGSFAAAADLPQSATADIDPKVTEKTDSKAVAKVNSAGTILEVIPPKKPIAEPPAPVKDNTVKNAKVARRKPATQPKPVAIKPEPKEDTDESAAKNDVENTVKKPAAKIPQPKNNRTINSAKTAKTPTAKKPAVKKSADNAEQKVSAQPDPLASVQLVILLKNGDRVERLMSEVFNVSVGKSQITVITKNGKIERYNLLDVQKMTIE